jgi:F0F1-type ATP synthase assembly protein I
MPKPWLRHAGLGIELGGTTVGCGAIGYGIDRWMGNTTPYATAACLLIGFAFAMFRFIQNVTRSPN